MILKVMRGHPRISFLCPVKEKKQKKAVDCAGYLKVLLRPEYISKNTV
jgi:hypothetical protein